MATTNSKPMYITIAEARVLLNDAYSKGCSVEMLGPMDLSNIVIHNAKSIKIGKHKSRGFILLEVCNISGSMQGYKLIMTDSVKDVKAFQSRFTYVFR